MLMEQFLFRNQLKGTEISYKGSAPALQDVMAGLVDFMMVDIATALPQLPDGKIVALATTSKERSPLAKDVPTLDESGQSNWVESWLGITYRAGTPKSVTDKISQAFKTVLAQPGMQKLIEERGLVVAYREPADFKALAMSVNADMATLIKERNIKVEGQ